MLITGQPDKMLTDLRNSKGSRELSAMAMWILVSGENRNVSNLVFSILAMVRDTARSLLHCTYKSYFLLEQPSAEGLSYRCLMQPSGSQHLRKSRSQ